MYIRRQKDKPRGRKLLFGFLFLISAWLFASIITDKPPQKLCLQCIDWISGNDSDYPRYSELMANKIELDSSMVRLQKEMLELNEDLNAVKAIVRVDANTLNMRAKPVIGSPVVLQIPSGAIVVVLEYDDLQMEVEGESGIWVKVKYGSYIGWVWGNYLEIMAKE